jgi:hypothetical protein
MTLLALTPKKLNAISAALRNAPLFVACIVVSLAIEAFAAAGILGENSATVEIAGVVVVLAYAEMIMSVACSLGSLALSAAAASMKSDPRPEQQKRAFGAQLLAVCLLTAPVYYAGNCLAYQRQLDAWSAYSGSAAEAADRALAAGESPDGLGVDSVERRDAALRLRQGVRPERAEFDLLATAWIAFLLSCNMLAVRLGWRVRPETAAEAKARRNAARAAKAAATREKNLRKKTAANVFTLRRA